MNVPAEAMLECEWKQVERMNKMGFGFLRFKKTGADYNWEAISNMVDCFIQRGGTYFDTCYTYLNGASEEAIRHCVVDKYDRSSVQICDKIPGYRCNTRDDTVKYFDALRRRCGTEYLDVLMLHWLNAGHCRIAEQLKQFDFLEMQKKAGNALRIGFSYHDSAELLDQILARHPQIDVVQIQLNYLDWDSAGIQSRLCYETCVKHGKSVIVMEPLRGGSLAVVPEAAETILRRAHPDWSAASWGLRFAMSQDAVETVLSGMNSLSQVESNMTEVQPLTKEEEQILFSVRNIINGKTFVPCTGCRYCEEHCPVNIAIPDCFSMLNELHRSPDEGWKIAPSYESLVRNRGKASACVSCGACAKHCPQKIDIPEFIKKAAATLEK